jgi:hypothetical protein
VSRRLPNGVLYPVAWGVIYGLITVGACSLSMSGLWVY